MVEVDLESVFEGGSEGRLFISKPSACLFNLDDRACQGIGERPLADCRDRVGGVPKAESHWFDIQPIAHRSTWRVVRSWKAQHRFLLTGIEVNILSTTSRRLALPQLR